jgi:hypothetical protein
MFALVAFELLHAVVRCQPALLVSCVEIQGANSNERIRKRSACFVMKLRHGILHSSDDCYRNSTCYVRLRSSVRIIAHRSSC